MNRDLILFGIGLGLVLVIGAALGARRVVEVVGDVGEAVNPLNPENVFYSGASGATTVLTQREETFGGWLAELFNPATRAVRDMLEKPMTAP